MDGVGMGVLGLAASDLVVHLGGVPVLHGVSVGVAPGEVVAVTGPSGSGKSTLLLALAGVLPITSGSIFVGGVDASGLDDDARARLRREKLRVVMQFGLLVPDLSAVDNVALPLRLAGVRPTAARAEAQSCLRLLGVDAVGGRLAGQMSGGQRQRVAIAKALVGSPQLVLADEPTGALDSRSAATVLREFLALARGRNAAVLMVTHDRDVAAAADRQVRLADGLAVDA